MPYTTWEIVHPRFSREALGPFLPTFLVEEDKRSAAEQFNERYPFGGWQPFGKGKFKLLPDNSLGYPGDPPQPPLAMTKLRDETIILYPGDFIAIIQPDRSFDVARLD